MLCCTWIFVSQHTQTYCTAVSPYNTGASPKHDTDWKNVDGKMFAATGTSSPIWLKKNMHVWASSCSYHCPSVLLHQLLLHLFFRSVFFLPPSLHKPAPCSNPWPCWPNPDPPKPVDTSDMPDFSWEPVLRERAGWPRHVTGHNNLKEQRRLLSLNL